MKLDNFWLNSAIFVFTVKAFWTILLVMVFKRGYYEWRIPEINFQGFIINREIRQRFLIMGLGNKEDKNIEGGGLSG